MLLYGTCDLQQLLSHPEVAVNNASYLQEAADVYYESQQVGADLFSLCVLQGECATVASTQNNVWIGSQDATTCLVAMLACPSSRIVWVAHLDSVHFGDRDIAGIEHALEQMQQPQLYLVGGYCDAAGQGPKLAQAFLQLLHSLAKPIHVALCCVAQANTAADGAPRCCQLVLDTSSWTVHPWVFVDRGPDLARRFAEKHCRCDRRCQATPIWDQQQQQLVLPAFDPTSIDSWQIMGYERLCAMPDQKLLQYCSTSPDHEPPWFTQDMRDMMQWLVAAQEPDSQERRSAQATGRYRHVDGSWQLVQQPAGTAAAATEAATEAAAAAAVL